MRASQDPIPAPVDWTSVMRDHYPVACQIIKRQMSPGLRARFDAEDFVGDAIAELMVNPAGFVEKGPALLVVVARRRMIDAMRSPRSRLMPLEVDIVDQSPRAESVCEAADLRDWMLNRAASLGERSLVDLRCHGHTLPEIAVLTGRGLRTLQRRWKAFARATGHRCDVTSELGHES